MSASPPGRESRGSTTMRSRLTVSLGGLVAVLGLVGATGIAAVTATAGSFEEADEQLREDALPLIELRAEVLLAEEPGSSSVLSRSTLGTARFEAARADVAQLFGDVLSRGSSDEQRLVERAQRSWARAVATRRSVLRGDQTNGMILYAQLAPFRDGVSDAARALEEARAAAFRDVDAEARQSQQAKRMAQWSLALLLVLAGLVAVVARLWLLRGVLRPAAALVECARRLGHGELFPFPPVVGARELEDVAAALDEMRCQLERSYAELSHNALHDSLTGLANRTLFLDRVEHAMAAARRSGDRPTVLLVDLDGFKRVIDAGGHATSDAILVEVAGRLQQCVRDGDTIARFGRDEFALLVPAGAGDEVALRVIGVLGPAFEFPTGDLFLTATIGISEMCALGDEPGELLRRADLALAAAKRSGGRTWRSYEAAFDQAATGRVRLEGELHHALARGELVVHYQPVVDLQDGGVVGLEALVRWEHPRDGLLLPGHFLPAAEQAGLVTPIGWWVLETACRQVASWSREDPALARLTVSVNVSASHLEQWGFVGRVRTILAGAGLSPSRLALEITESAMVDPTGATQVALEELAVLGVRIAIDDFGTGYSALGYLSALAVDILKIDKSFIDPVLDGRPSSLLETIVSLGSNLQLVCVAEGIEHPVQAKVLRDLGCRLGQGFLYSRAVPAEEVPKVVDELAPIGSRGTKVTAALP